MGGRGSLHTERSKTAAAVQCVTLAQEVNTGGRREVGEFRLPRTVSRCVWFGCGRKEGLRREVGAGWLAGLVAPVALSAVLKSQAESPFAAGQNNLACHLLGIGKAHNNRHTHTLRAAEAGVKGGGKGRKEGKRQIGDLL